MYITAARHRKSSESGGKRNASKVQRHRRTAQETGQGGQGFLPLVCGTAGRGFGEGLHAFHCRALRDEQKCQASDRHGKGCGQREVRIPLLPPAAGIHRCGVQGRAENPAEEPHRVFGIQERRR